MASPQHPIYQLLKRDPRYSLDAYQFVRDALSFAHDELGMGQAAEASESEEGSAEAHLTGQQLCQAIRLYAQERYGLLALVVLRSWGVTRTGDFGDIVYNLIEIGLMKKSESDRREDFDDVYDFVEAFDRHFKITESK